MSLDIFFHEKKTCPNCAHVLTDGEEVFWKNITHNLTRMADAAGFYKQLWHPEETDVVTAQQLGLHIEKGIAELKANPDNSFRGFRNCCLPVKNTPDSIVTTST